MPPQATSDDLTPRQNRLLERLAIRGLEAHMRGMDIPPVVETARFSWYMRSMVHGDGWWDVVDFTSPEGILDDVCIFLMDIVETCLHIRNLRNQDVWHAYRTCMHDAMHTLITHWEWSLIDPAHPASKAHAAKRVIKLLHMHAQEQIHEGAVYTDLLHVFHAMFAWMTFVKPRVSLARAASWPQPLH